jgi:hypothetical protein
MWLIETQKCCQLGCRVYQKGHVLTAMQKLMPPAVEARPPVVEARPPVVEAGSPVVEPGLPVLRAYLFTYPKCESYLS